MSFTPTQFALNELTGKAGKAVQAINKAVIKSHVPLGAKHFSDKPGTGRKLSGVVRDQTGRLFDTASEEILAACRRPSD